MLKEEVWGQLENLSRYRISNKGRVKCVLRRNNAYNNYYKADYIMKDFDFKGYRRIQLRTDDGKTLTIGVHRLVALVFLPLVEGKTLVNHKDGNKSNNNVENLEWCTNQENIHHAINTGLLKTKNGFVLPRREKLSSDVLRELQIKTLNKHRSQANRRAKELFSKRIEQLDLSGNHIKTWCGSREIERELGISHSQIIAVCKGKRKTSHGYIWKYADLRKDDK